MRAPEKTAAVLIALLLAAFGFAPSAGARPIAGISAAYVAAPAPGHRGAKEANPRERRLQRKRQLRRAATRREDRGKHERSAKNPGPALGPGPAPEPAPEPQPAPEPTPEPAPASLLEAGFEQGLAGWNTAGVGEATPTVVSDIVRSGSKSVKVQVTGSLHRSELILGGNGTGSTSGSVRFHEGDEYWYGFSFYIVSMVYGKPGAHNLIMQFKSADSGSPEFGLQLWNYRGDDGEYEDNPKGLWSHGSGMGGDRFLALAPEHTWHDVAIHFKASEFGAGFYEVYLDGNLVDSHSGVSMISADAPHAYIKDGIYRNGDTIPGTSEIRLDAARLGNSRASVSG